MKRRIAFSLAALAGAYALCFRPPAEARPDVVSAASLVVGAASITATSALINYSKDKYDYGTRTLCYDPAPATPKNNCTTKTASGNAGSFTITGLTPAKAYNYSIKAVDTRGGEKPYTSTGTFTTKAATTAIGPGMAPSSAIPGFPALSVDAAGRRLPDRTARGFKATLPGR